MSVVPEEAVRQQIANLFRRGGFRPLERYLPEQHREDRVAEAIALTLAMALRYAARGRRLDDALLVHHARLRAIDHSRNFVSSHGRGVDALNQRLFVAAKVEVLHVDGVVDANGDDDTVPEGDQQLVGLAVRRNGDPSEHLAAAVDLQRWLETLPERDQRLLALRAAGYTLEDAAAELRCSISTVFARCQELGVQLAELAGLPVPKRAYRRKPQEKWLESPSRKSAQVAA